MPSVPISACVRQGDRDLLIPCCRFTGGPTTRSVIEELITLYAPTYGVMAGRRELILFAPNHGDAERIKKGDWVVIDGPIPHVYPPEEFALKYLPMHHSVGVTTIIH